MELKTVKVLEIMDKDVEKLRKDESPLRAVPAELEMQADLIVYKGRVIKNALGAAFSVPDGIHVLCACPLHGKTSLVG